MTNDERQLIAAYQRSGLALQGMTYAEAVRVECIRISLQLAAQATTRGKPAPIQPALI
ncbi:MAG: hypothetical protein ACKO0Z_09880 [Betaproteobacteria bacterium]